MLHYRGCSTKREPAGCFLHDHEYPTCATRRFCGGHGLLHLLANLSYCPFRLRWTFTSAFRFLPAPTPSLFGKRKAGPALSLNVAPSWHCCSQECGSLLGILNLKCIRHAKPRQLTATATAKSATHTRADRLGSQEPVVATHCATLN